MNSVTFHKFKPPQLNALLSRLVQTAETILVAMAAERAGIAKNEPDDYEVRRAKEAYHAALKSITVGMLQLFRASVQLLLASVYGLARHYIAEERTCLNVAN